MMKKITKFVTLLLALAMVFSLAACSSGKGKDKANGSADIAALIATEPNSADEAAKLYQQLMQKENDILAANSELWNKVFLSANKNSTMIEDGTNYGDFLLATIESAKDGFSADELKTLKAGAEQIKEIEGKLTILEQKYPGCGTAPGAGDSVSAEEAGMTVDQEGFKALMEEQKVRARKAREALGDLGWAGIEFGKDMPATEFVGYDRSSEQGRVLALVADGELRDELAQGVEGILVLDQTPFYAEMGGQVGDHGTIQGPNGTFQVTDVQKNKGGKFMHSGKVVSGTLSVGETVTASIDMERRKAIMRAHSATHLLDAALKKVLGDHVHQAGSLVEPDRLRFDFTHFEAITPEQLAQIDKLVNDAILEGYPVATEVLPIEEAKKKGAVAMFGEKYGDIVRVVEMGDFSMEFCGGTHLDNTAKAGPFRIKSEGSVASGVRRIEATVGRLSLDTMNKNQELLFHAAQVLKTTPGELAAKAEQQAAEMKELRHELEKFKSEASLGEARQFLTAAKNVGGLKVLTAIRNGMDANALRQMGDFLRDKAPDVVAVLASANGEKITFLAVCGPEAVKRGIKAGDLVKSVCAICGGKGGGKPDSAMGGGSDLLKLDDALATVDDFVAEKLK